MNINDVVRNKYGDVLNYSSLPEKIKNYLCKLLPDLTGTLKVEDAIDYRVEGLLWCISKIKSLNDKENLQSIDRLQIGNNYGNFLYFVKDKGKYVVFLKDKISFSDMMCDLDEEVYVIYSEQDILRCTTFIFK